MVKSFLTRHRRGPPNGMVRVKRRGLSTKLALRYDEDGELSELAVGSDASSARIYFDWVNESHAFKTPRGLGGQQWSGGVVVTGTVYDDDSGGDGGGRPVKLDHWVDDCISTMIDQAR